VGGNFLLVRRVPEGKKEETSSIIMEVNGEHPFVNYRFPRRPSL